MQKIILTILSFLLIANFSFAEIKRYPLNKDEKEAMDDYIKTAIINKDLWTNKYAVGPIGAEFKNKKYYMQNFHNFSKVNAIDVSVNDAECFKNKNQICTYLVYFKDEKGQIEPMPIITMFDADVKKYDIFYSNIPVKDAEFAFFLEKNPLK